MTTSGVHQAAGGFEPLARWRRAWADLPTANCRLAGCQQPAAALFEAWSGGAPTLFAICADHAPLAANAGYPVTWPPDVAGVPG